MAKAIVWLRENYAKALNKISHTWLVWVCRTCMRISRALTAMSPLQYQKQLRLHAARARILVDGLDAATATFEVGYETGLRCRQR